MASSIDRMLCARIAEGDIDPIILSGNYSFYSHLRKTQLRLMERQTQPSFYRVTALHRVINAI